MATTSETDGWKTGAMIAVVVVVGAVAVGGGVRLADLPYAEILQYVGGLIGAVLAFVLFSYVYYGR